MSRALAVALAFAALVLVALDVAAAPPPRLAIVPIKEAALGADGTTAVHEGWLYWTIWKSPGFVRACQLPACATVVQVSDAPNVVTLTFDATHLYFTTFAGDLATTVGPGRILRVAKLQTVK